MHWLSSFRSRAAAGLPTHSNYTGFDETVNAVGLNPSSFAWYLSLQLQAIAGLWEESRILPWFM